MDKATKKLCARAHIVIALIEKLTDERKKLYLEHDELVGKLVAAPGLEASGLRIVRTFARGNTQWGHGPVREFVLERVEAEAPAKVAKK